MSRCLLGVGLLLLFLAGGLWIGEKMTAVHTQVSHQLREASQAALAGDMPRSRSLAFQAKEVWDRGWNTVATVADHGPMDEIDGLFAQLEAYSDGEQETEFAALCGRLEKLVEAMGEAHGLTWWNLL